MGKMNDQSSGHHGLPYTPPKHNICLSHSRVVKNHLDREKRVREREWRKKRNGKERKEKLRGDHREMRRRRQINWEARTEMCMQIIGIGIRG